MSGEFFFHSFDDRKFCAFDVDLIRSGVTSIISFESGSGDFEGSAVAGE